MEFSTEFANFSFSTGTDTGSIIALVVTSVLTLGILVLMIASFWKLFKKAGNKGWKILIPFYNEYTLTKIIWRPAIFWIGLALAVISDVLFFIAIIGIALKISTVADLAAVADAIAASSTSIILFVIASLLAIAYGVIEFIKVYKLSKAYGHGIGYFFGIIFLPVIFIPIMAFGKSQYCKNA